MATDTWRDGTANWDTSGDWSAGVPIASSDVVINKGSPGTGSFGTVNSISIGVEGGLVLVNFGEGDLSSVTGAVTNSGTLSLDPAYAGGSSLAIGGMLTNDGTIRMGSTLYPPGSTIEAAGLTNFIGATLGTIDLSGGSDNSAAATLDVGSAAGFGAAGVLYGNVNVFGDALIEFASGQITTIAAGSILYLNGSQAFVADASDASSNSALRGLDTVAGSLLLADGATVPTSAT